LFSQKNPKKKLTFSVFLKKIYTSLVEFVKWFPEQEETTIELLHSYDYKATLERVLNYASKLKGGN